MQEGGNAGVGEVGIRMDQCRDRTMRLVLGADQDGGRPRALQLSAVARVRQETQASRLRPRQGRDAAHLEAGLTTQREPEPHRQLSETEFFLHLQHSLSAVGWQAAYLAPGGFAGAGAQVSAHADGLDFRTSNTCAVISSCGLP